MGETMMSSLCPSIGDQTVTPQLSQTDGVFLAGKAPPVSRIKFKVFPGCSKLSCNLEASFPSASHLAEPPRLP